MADLYIEKKGLQDQVAKLNQDISHRDRLDAEIEACVCTMFERTRLLEEENASLNARLNDKAANSSSSAPSAVLGPPTRSPEAWPSVSGSQQGTVGQSLPPSVSAIIAKEKERVSNEQGKGQVLSLEDTNNTIATNNPREGDPPQ